MRIQGREFVADCETLGDDQLDDVMTLVVDYLYELHGDVKFKDVIAELEWRFRLDIGDEQVVVGCP